MLTIEPTGAVLGATVHGIDLAQPFDDGDMGQILLALGRHGVLRFPDQHLDLAALKRFSEQFGEIQGTRSARRSRRAPIRKWASSRTRDREPARRDGRDP
jgi:alpha-ketoglutarate-dependent taurine dioxygenase